MSRWPVVALGDLLTLALDPHPVAVDRAYPNLGIYSFGRGTFHKQPIGGESTSATTLYRIRTGQFIYSRLFDFEGAYSVVSREFDGYFVSNEFPTFDIDRDHLDASYLRWLFTRPSTWASLASGATGMGDRRQRIHPEHVLSLAIPLPPLPEQRRIAAKLDAAADHVAARSRALAAIEAELNATVLIAFDRISADAPRRPMSEVAPLVRRPVAIDENASYTEIGVKRFYKGIFHRRTMQGSDFSWQELFYVRPKDIVFSNLMAWEQAIAVANQSDDGCVGNHRMLTCEPQPTCCEAGFLDYFFKTQKGFAAIVAASPGSIARNKTLSPTLLADIQVPIPSLDAQRWFDSVQHKAASVRARHAAASADLDALLPSLLAEAFGESATATAS